MIFIKKYNKNDIVRLILFQIRKKIYDVNTAVTKMIHFNLILQQ